MAEAADAEDRHEIARARARIAERIEGGDAGAEQRCCPYRGKVVRDGGKCLLGRDHVVGIATVIGDARHLHDDAQDEIAPSAIGAHPAMTAMPADADALPHAPGRDPWPERSTWPAI